MSATHAIRGGPAAVHSVTTAPAARSADRDARMRRYVVQMSVRTACFIGAVFAHGWLQIVLIIGAIVLPYVAVVAVNNAPPPTAGQMDREPVDAPALTVAPDPASPRSDDVVIDGEVVDEAPAASTGRGAAGALPAGRDRRHAHHADEGRTV